MSCVRLLAALACCAALAAEVDPGALPLTPSNPDMHEDEVWNTVGERHMPSCFNMTVTPCTATAHGSFGAFDQDGSECPEGELLRFFSTVHQLRLTHVHDAVDHPGAKVPVIRLHNYRQIHQHSSFGPGVFSQYDCTLRLEGGSKHSTRVWNPVDAAEYIVRDKDAQGVGKATRTQAIEGLRYYAETYSPALDYSLLTPVVDQSLAASAVLTTWGGKRFYFEIIDLAGDGSDRRGRLVRIDHADTGDCCGGEGAGGPGAGETTHLAYWFAADGSGLPPSLAREALWSVAFASCGGEWALFGYDWSAGTFAGSYPVVATFTPSGLTWYAYDGYRQDLTPGTDGDALTVKNTGNDHTANPTQEVDSQTPVYGLAAVFGTAAGDASFEYGLNWRSKCQTVEFDDPASNGASKHTQVHFTLGLWWENEADDRSWFDAADAGGVDGPMPLLSQAENLVRLVLDNETSRYVYLNWADDHETIYYYQADDEVFGGPRFARYKTTAGYPNYTQYATDWFEVPYDGFVGFLDESAMSWGSKESYGHDFFRRVRSISGDLGRNGTIGFDDATGMVTNNVLHSEPVWVE